MALNRAFAVFPKLYREDLYKWGIVGHLQISKTTGKLWERGKGHEADSQKTPAYFFITINYTAIMAADLIVEYQFTWSQV